MFRLTQERKRAGLTQIKLAHETGIHPTIISQLENGKIYPYKKHRERLEEFFNVPADELFMEVSEDE